MLKITKDTSIETIFLYLDKGNDVNEKYPSGNGLIHLIFSYKDIGKIKKFLKKQKKYNIDINLKDSTGANVLWTACAFEHIDVIKEILKYDIDVDVEDNDGDTPLYWCVINKLDENIIKEIMLRSKSQNERIKKLLENVSTSYGTRILKLFEETRKNKKIGKFSRLLR